MKKNDTYLRDSISMECRVAITFYRLGRDNSLIIVADLSGLGKNTTLEIIKECCEAIGILLKPLVFKKPSLAWMKKITVQFEALHRILLIIGAIDGSYIPIVASTQDPISYYYQKKFYACLLQGFVNSKYKFWNYNFGWCRWIYDWALFQKIEIGKNHKRCNSSFQVH